MQYTIKFLNIFHGSRDPGFLETVALDRLLFLNPFDVPRLLMEARFVIESCTCHALHNFILKHISLFLTPKGKTSAQRLL